jgi:hypothetical protein
MGKIEQEAECFFIPRLVPFQREITSSNSHREMRHRNIQLPELTGMKLQS